MSKIMKKKKKIICKKIVKLNKIKIIIKYKIKIKINKFIHIFIDTY